MRQFAGTSLKTRLYLLVLAAFIPVAGLIVFITEEQKEIETAAIVHKTTLLAQQAADAESRQVAATGNLLLAIAEAYHLVDGRPQRLVSLMDNLMAQAKGYAALGVLDPAGNLVAGRNAPRMAGDAKGRTWLADILKHKLLVMRAYRAEHVKGEPLLYFARPVADSASGTIEAVVFAALDLDWMNHNMFRQLAELPEGSRLTLLDEGRGVLRYDTGTARWVAPQPLDAALQEAIVHSPAGTLVVRDENGRTRLYAFARLDSPFRNGRATVVLDLPRSVALADSNRLFFRNVALLAASALLAVLAIWWAADVYLLRRIGAMVQASRRLSAGDLGARIGRSGMRDELDHLAGVFDEMAASLQMRIERETQVMRSLEHSREQLRRLTTYQNEVREQERIRIAREIHDQLGQSLTILKMDLSWIRKHMPPPDAAAKAKLEAMVGVIEEAMEVLHAVTAELRPVILDDFGLAAAIEWQAEAFARRSGIACHLENDGFEPDLPKTHATALFRIFQETLTNILRHAGAIEVVVRLEKRDGALFFQIADNGRGIRQEEIDAPDAFGLLGIRERLYPLGGRVAFEGRPGQGTRVTIYLPMPRKGEVQ
jgi:signal transduction histidine kinase